MNLKTATKARRCNAFPAVWAAMYGCEGSTRRWHYVAGHFGRQQAEFVCGACEAAKAKSSGLIGAAYQQHLRDVQGAAGVEDYRTAKVKRVNGRPVLA